MRRLIRARRSFDAVPIRLQLSEEELARFAVNRPDFPGVEVRPRLTRHYPRLGTGVHAHRLRRRHQRGRPGAHRRRELRGHHADRQARRGARLRGRPARRDRLPAAAGERAGPARRARRHQHARPGAQGTRRRQRPVPGRGRPPAAGGGGRARRPACRGGGDRSAQRRRARLRQHADLRPERLRARPHLRRVRGALERHRRAALRPRAARRVPARLHHQAAGGARRAAERRCHARGAGDCAAAPSSCRARATATATGRRAATAAWTCTWPSRCRATSTSTACRPSWASTACTISSPQFGLGAKTGIDIAGERAGLLPSTAWKKGAFKKKEAQIWFPGETVISGIGQGYMLATPLQLAHAIATVAMRGQRFRPRLVRGMRDARTGEVRELPPTRAAAGASGRPQVLGRDHRRHGRRHQRPVGHRAAQPGRARPTRSPARPAPRRCSASGRRSATTRRTSPSACATTRCSSRSRRPTTRNSRSRCVVENGRSGSGTAAPIARKIFDAYLLPPEHPAAVAPDAPPAPVAGNEE